MNQKSKKRTDAEASLSEKLSVRFQSFQNLKSGGAFAPRGTYSRISCPFQATTP